MEPGCTATADLNRSRSATPVDSRTTARAVNARRPSRRLDAGATSLDGNLDCGVASDEEPADTIDSKDFSAPGPRPLGRSNGHLRILQPIPGRRNDSPGEARS